MLPESDTELVLTTSLSYEPDWLVDDVSVAAARFVEAGGEIISPPRDIPLGRVVVVRDPFGNVLVLLDLSRGTYITDEVGNVTAVQPPPRS